MSHNCDDEMCGVMTSHYHRKFDEEGITLRNIYECECPCHRSGGAMVHCLPCYETCYICGMHIRFGMIEEHIHTKHSDYEDDDE